MVSGRDFDAGHWQTSQRREVSSKDVGIAPRLCPVKTNASCDQFGFVQVYRAVDARLQALDHRLFHFCASASSLLPKRLNRASPLCQFGIGQRDVLDRRRFC